MGHCEMGLAVAGLEDKEIKVLTKKLAQPDWKAFTSGERVAFHLGYRLSKEPAKVSENDIKTLVKAVGPDRALDLIWHTGWCNYMTRVADAFQFPLEKTNVFKN